MHNIKSKIYFFITALFLCSTAYASKERTIYIMLNVDNTLVDRTLPCTQPALDQLLKEGFKGQMLEFDADEKSSPKFISMYEKIASGQSLIEESEYMSKIVSQKVSENKFHIRECVIVRPSIQHFLERLNNIGKPVKILLTSRNDDARTSNLHDKLNLKIAGKSFKDTSTFIPRNWFRIKTQGGSVKSSELLREKYPIIQEQDIVVLFDFLPSSHFIKGSHIRDFNVEVSKFRIKEYNEQQDIKEMDEIFSTIQKNVVLKGINLAFENPPPSTLPSWLEKVLADGFYAQVSHTKPVACSSVPAIKPIGLEQNLL